MPGSRDLPYGTEPWMPGGLSSSPAAGGRVRLGELPGETEAMCEETPAGGLV
jgi:hypothetical protein